jgi:hypothetical protein
MLGTATKFSAPHLERQQAHLGVFWPSFISHARLRKNNNLSPNLMQ